MQTRASRIEDARCTLAVRYAPTFVSAQLLHPREKGLCKHDCFPGMKRCVCLERHTPDSLIAHIEQEDTPFGVSSCSVPGTGCFTRAREILTSSAGNGSNGVILGNFRFVFCYHYRLPGRDVSDPFNRLMRIPRILLHSHQIIQRII